MIDPKPGDIILDLGCGSGYFMEIFCKKGVPSFGLDLDFSSLSLANKWAPGYYSQGVATSIHVKDNTFDKILFTDVIEHIEDDERALSEISRITKNGGIVLITTASLEGILIRSPLNSLCHDVPGTPEYHFKEGYTRDELIKLMEKCNIHATEVRYTTVFLGELFIEMLKLVFSFTKKDFSSQADLWKVQSGHLFTVYKNLLFPVMWWISKIEDKLLSKYLKGIL